MQKKMIKHLKYAAEFVLELVYPELCMFCGEALDVEREEKRYLTCLQCLVTLPIISYQENGRYCLLSYEGQTEQLIKRFKYSGAKRQAYSAGLLMAKWADFAALEEVDAALPVPLHIKRLKQRGYNQAEVICRALAVEKGIPILTGLKRVKETQALFGLTVEQREKAVTGAFEFMAQAGELDIQGKTLLLVDDILTTGATLNECAKVLKKCGAKQVYCMAFAYTELTQWGAE